MVTIDRWFFSVRYPKANSAGVRAAETTRFCRAPNLITICEVIPPLQRFTLALHQARMSNHPRISWDVTFRSARPRHHRAGSLSCLGSTEILLELREHLLDRGIVRAVRWRRLTLAPAPAIDLAT